MRADLKRPYYKNKFFTNKTILNIRLLVLTVKQKNMNQIF